jgi:hypothetical protein
VNKPLRQWISPVLYVLVTALADLGGLLVMAALLLFSFLFAGRIQL